MTRDSGTSPTPAPRPGPATSPDVFVVGAGPTGLLLAGDLAAAGLSVTLLERRPHEIANTSRALVVHARTLEQLDARGLADELLPTGYPVDALQLFGEATLHPTRLRTRFPYVLTTPQYEVEKLLERRAREAGVTFRHETELTGLAQDGKGVEVRLRGADGAVSTERAAYLVGTDGVRSTVREALGLPFPGESVIRSIVLADVRLAEPPENPFTINAVDDAFALIAPYGDGWYRVAGWNRHRQLPDGAPADLDEVRELTRLALGTDYGMHDARWTSRFHSDERQVPDYRVGRALLAGDAAHVHSPAGGQGMNTGLQDAANLSWKLAAVVRGHSPESLLDTYHEERHPVGRAVLRSSGAIIRLALASGPAGRTARGLGARILNRVRPLGDRMMGTVSGIGIAYRAERGAHPLAGKRAPDIRLAPAPGGGADTGESGPASDGGIGTAPEPVRLYEALRAGRFVLVAPADEPLDGDGRADGGTRGGRTDSGRTYGQADGARAYNRRTGGGRVTRAVWADPARRTALLVRPDGYIGWATDATDPDERADALRAALIRWTGSPRP